ncbi:MAG: MCP four helix bundle domain-containing protein [Bdellovibrionaceae bacterium]|nr:MCP four helix bundle domain-containing protein [Pseudobdellovibrionaceae bacterium]
MKLFSLVGFLVLVSGVIGGMSFWTVNRVGHSYAVIKDVSLPNTRNALEILVLFRAARADLLQLIAPGTPTAADLETIKRFNSNWDQIQALNKEYLEIPFQPGEKELFDAYMETSQRWKALADKAIGMYHESEEGTPKRAETAAIIVNDFRAVAGEIRDDLYALAKYHENAANENGRLAEKAETEGRNLILLVGGLGIGLGLLFASLLTSSLVRTFNQIALSLSQGSKQVSAAAGQIAEAAQNLSSATTEQAASLEQTASAVEEMNSMVKRNAENSVQTADVSTQSQTSAENGKGVVQNMIQAIGDINTSNTRIMEQIDDSNRQIADIVNVISEIGSKTKIINDIVFQTKLLSFNASVEAARAGEHGKGFAVVAEEIGNLAQVSGNAAKEISTMLEDSVRKVEGIVRETKTKVEQLTSEGRIKVEEGTRIAQECGDVLNEIVTNITSVSRMAGEISTASREQAQGVSEINKAMGQLDQVTQQNAATSEEAASAAEELSAQAESMQGLVQSLMEAVQGEGHATAPAAVTGSPAAKTPQAKAPSKPVEEEGAKVIPLRARPTQPKVAETAAPKLKSAAGDGTMPSYDHPDFRES